MALEDELRDLFHDDRLELQVKPGADEAVVTGARRIRRRRTAVAGAFAVTVLAGTVIGLANLGAPTSLPPAETMTTTSTTTTPAASTVTSTVQAPVHTETVTVTVPVPGNDNPVTVSEQPVGPAGYGKLKLGMSQQDATATGVLIQPAKGDRGGCPAYASESNPNDGDAVVIHPKLGVARITLPGFAKTSAGIGVGSSTKDLKAKYPSAVEFRNGFTVSMPGTPEWHYVFLLDDAGNVSKVRMEVKTSDCVLS